MYYSVRACSDGYFFRLNNLFPSERDVNNIIPIIPQLSPRNHPRLPFLQPDACEEYFVGAVAGVNICHYNGDRIGRKSESNHESGFGIRNTSLLKFGEIGSSWKPELLLKSNSILLSKSQSIPGGHPLRRRPLSKQL